MSTDSSIKISPEDREGSGEEEDQNFKTESIKDSSKTKVYEQTEKVVTTDDFFKKFKILISCLLYIACAVAMTIVNKYLLSVYDFKNPNFLFLWQNTVVLTIQCIRIKTGSLKFTFNPNIAKQWLGATFCYVATLTTSGFSLAYMPVPMVTVFKNLTVCLIAWGDQIFFGAELSQNVVFSIGLMVLGSILAAITDLSFSFIGYFWMGLHIVAQACYVLYIRKLKLKLNLHENEQIIYNNIMSIPVFIILAYLNSEFHKASEFKHWNDFGFIINFLFQGFGGLAISLATFFCMNVAGPTSYAIAGALNKVPLTILGFFLFSDPMNFSNGSCVFFGILSGIIYSKAKMDEQAAKSAKK